MDHWLQTYNFVILIRVLIGSESDCACPRLLRAHPQPPRVFQHPPRYFADDSVYSVLAGVVRMLGAGYREVNQGQSSDPLALFGTSKAYSSLFSQYNLAAISAV